MGEGSQCGRSQDQTSASTMSGVRCVVSATVDGGLGARVVSALATGRMGSQSPLLQQPSYLYPSEAGVLCTAFPVDIGFSKDADSAAAFRGLGLQAPTTLFPRFCLLYMFQYMYLQMYRCVEFSGFLLRWAEASLLNCGCFR